MDDVNPYAGGMQYLFCDVGLIRRHAVKALVRAPESRYASAKASTLFNKLVMIITSRQTSAL